MIKVGGKSNDHRIVKRFWTAAGVTPWARLWQTLRSSCEKHLAMQHPQYAMSQWLGHAITVSGKHYTNGVPAEVFDRCVRGVEEPDDAQRQAQRAGGNRLKSPENGDTTGRRESA